MHDFLAVRSAAAHRVAPGWFRQVGMLIFLVCAFFGLSTRAADTNSPPAAKFKISGYGIFGDLRLKRIIKLLEVPKTKPQFFDANFMEDTALILKSKLRADGFLAPRIVIIAFTEDGKRLRFV